MFKAGQKSQGVTVKDLFDRRISSAMSIDYNINTTPDATQGVAGSAAVSVSGQGAIEANMIKIASQRRMG